MPAVLPARIATIQLERHSPVKARAEIGVDGSVSILLV